MTRVLIAGGGLAGCAAAIRLARAGRPVTLFERSLGPHHKVCGEFLSGEALAELSELGLDPAAMGAKRLRRVLVAGRSGSGAAPLPFPALSLTRRALDEALLERAVDAGAQVRRGVQIRGAARISGGWSLRLPHGETVEASTLIAATGKHDLRGRARPRGLHGDLVGLKAYYRPGPNAAAALRGTVAVVFFPGGYLGLQPVEGNEINACLVVRRAKLGALGGDPWAVFDHARAHAAFAAHALDGAVRATQKPLAIGRIPYGFVRRETDGAYHVGDQAAVIPSFCGEGMGLALRSGRLAAEAILRGENADAYQRGFASLVGTRVKGAALLSRALASPSAQRAAVGLASAAPRVVTGLAAATRTPRSRPNQTRADQPRSGRSSSATPSSS